MAFEKKPLNYDELEEIIEYSIDLEDRIEDGFENRTNLLQEYTFETVGTSKTFTGLDINQHGQYRIEMEFIHASASPSVNILMYLNGDETSNKYHSIATISAGTSAVASYYEDARIFGTQTASGASLNMATVILRKLGNSALATSDCKVNQDALIQHRSYAYEYKTSVLSNITSITIKGDVPNGIGAGSKIRIYKVQ